MGRYRQAVELVRCDWPFGRVGRLDDLVHRDSIRSRGTGSYRYSNHQTKERSSPLPFHIPVSALWFPKQAMDYFLTALQSQFCQLPPRL